MKTPVVPAALLLSMVAACAKPTARTSATSRAVAAVQDSIVGTVTYRERLALPPGAVLKVQLQDVSRPGAPATVVAEATVPARGRPVPMRFSLPYDTLRIDPTNTYTVQASIEAAGQPVLANAAAYPVITRGNAKRVQLTLRAVAQ